MISARWQSTALRSCKNKPEDTSGLLQLHKNYPQISFAFLKLKAHHGIEMRTATRTARLWIAVLASLPLVPTLAHAADAPEAPAPSPEYTAAEQECITKAESALKQKGLYPSEESNAYDAEFDVVYGACMETKGFSDTQVEPEETLPPAENLR